MAAIEITRKSALPVARHVGKVIIDLYIDDPNHTGTTCGMSFVINVVCAVNDARDYVAQGPDPHGDPSRTRVEAVFDFSTGNIVFRVNPSCKFLGNHTSQKECNPPKPEGDGNNVDVSQVGGGQVKVDTTFTQSEFPIPGGACAIHNTFVIRPDERSGDFYLTGHGAGFPSIAIIHSGRVVYADQGVHSTSLCYPVGAGGRDYNHSPPAAPPAGGTSTPTPTPAPARSVTTPNGLTVIVNKISRSQTGQYGEQLAPGTSFVRLAIGLRYDGPQAVTFDDSNLAMIDSLRKVVGTTGDGPNLGGDCGLRGPITVATGANFPKLVDECFLVEGDTSSPLTLVVGGIVDPLHGGVDAELPLVPRP